MVDVRDFKEIGCGCGNKEYIQTFEFKIVPAVMSQSGKETIAPMPARFVCTQCGKDVYDTIQELEDAESGSNIIL